MKKKTIIGLLCATFAMASGTLAANALLKQNVKIARADPSTITIYVTDSWDHNTIKLHQWGGSTAGTNFAWDDLTSMNYVGVEQYGHKVFRVDIPSDRTGFVFVYQDSGLKQSKDITTGIADNAGWYFDSWDGSAGKANMGTWSPTPYTVNYYGNENTSGSMASEEAVTDATWTLSTNSFVKTGYVFAGWNTSADGKGTAYANSATVSRDPTLSSGSLNLYAQWRKSYTSGRYIIGKFGSCDWDMDHAQIMSQSGDDDVLTLSLNYGDKIKAAWYNNDTGVLDNYYGYSKLYNGCGAYHYFSNDESDNIVCYARGSYTIYVNSTNDNISIELNGSLTAEHLAAQLMQFGENPSAGHCGDNDRFPAMKLIYLSLSPEEQATFQNYEFSSTAQFKNAFDRYVDWAAALSQDPWSNGGAGAREVVDLNNNQGYTVAIIVVVSLISLTAVGAFFFIRKKKEN